MRLFRFLIILSLCIVVGNLFAQKKEGPKIVKHSGKTFMAGGTFSGGTLSPTVFDSLILLPMMSMDTLNQPHPVTYFFFTYIERNLYEDSTGRPEILADYIGFNSVEGKVPEIWIKSLKERVKEGDTVLISNVESFYNDKKLTKFYTEPIKIIITK